MITQSIQVPLAENGGWEEIDRGTPIAIPGATIEMEPGVLYEVQYVSGDPITASISWLTAQINAAIGTLFGVRTEYVRVNGKAIQHGFMIPEEAGSQVRAMGLPLIGGVITLVVAALVIIGILLIIVYMFVPGGAETIDKLMRAIPGMAVMMGGAVITSILPSIAKVAGLVPLGIGGYMVFEAFMGPPPSPEPPSNGNGGDEYLGRVDWITAT